MWKKARPPLEKKWCLEAWKSDAFTKGVLLSMQALNINLHKILTISKSRQTNILLE